MMVFINIKKNSKGGNNKISKAKVSVKYSVRRWKVVNELQIFYYTLEQTFTNLMKIPISYAFGAVILKRMRP